MFVFFSDFCKFLNQGISSCFVLSFEKYKVFGHFPVKYAALWYIYAAETPYIISSHICAISSHVAARDTPDWIINVDH